MTLLANAATQTPADLAAAYHRVRRYSERLAQTLSPEDTTVQSMADASPTKWHLAHTTWFFETFLLLDQDDYRPFDAVFQTLFNSYYNSVGNPFPRAQRGVLSRPSLQQSLAYRQSVDEHIEQLLATSNPSQTQRRLLELGLHHEQQHQELIVTDIKHALAQNPTDPVYRDGVFRVGEAAPARWIDRPGGIQTIGHTGEGFAFDCEGPRHDVLLRPYQLANRPSPVASTKTSLPMVVIARHSCGYQKDGRR